MGPTYWGLKAESEMTTGEHFADELGAKEGGRYSGVLYMIKV